MKAVVVHQPGGPEVLQYETVPDPHLKAGWSIVEVKAFGINHSEIFTRRGDSPSVKFPRILGIECVGVIKETSDPQRLPVGQKVISIMGEMGRAFDGSYAELALLPNKQLYPVTTDLAWRDLAAVPETYYTAYGSLQLLQIKATDQVLVRGGSAGVGIAFLHLLKAQYPQIKVVGTTRQAAKLTELEQIGYDSGVLDQGGKLQTELKFDKILELVGPATVKDSFRHAQPGGIVCSTGELGNQWYLENFDPITDIVDGGYLTAFYSNNVDQQRLNQMLEFVATYQVDVTPAKVYRLKQVADAHRWLESGQSMGKAVVLTER